MGTTRDTNVRCAAFRILWLIVYQLITVDCYPLNGLSATGLGLHQSLPSYLPDYNGIFSLHALNFTPAAIDKAEKFLQVLNEDNALIANVSFGSLISTKEPSTTLEERHKHADETTDRLPDEVSGTVYFNEVDSVNTKADVEHGSTLVDVDSSNTKVDIEELSNTKIVVDSGNTKVDVGSTTTTVNLDEGNINLHVDSSNTKLKEDHEDSSTFPQIHVVTKTITSENIQSSTTTERTPTIKTEERTQTEEDVATTVEEMTTFLEGLRLKQSNSSDALLSGSDEEDPVEADEKHDIFDGLMKTIQSHWMDFVGKMKLSVLDVWKSISEHMMNRLENFAAAL